MKSLSELAVGIVIVGVMALTNAHISAAQQQGAPGNLAGGGPASWPTGKAPEPPALDTTPYKRKWLDLSYANLSEKQKLDIYLPAEGNGPFPVVCYVHGGGWGVSDKASMELENTLKEGMKRGWAVVSINYRYSSEAHFPAQIMDVKAAIRWLRANGAKYQLRTEKIGVWGSSSGGHLVALLGTSGGVEKLEGLNLGNAKESSRVQAVIDVSGPIDFLKMDSELEQDGFTNFAKHADARGPESNLLGKPIESVPELAKEANPETYIRGDAPPFLLEYGAKDNSVSVHQAILFAQKLEAAIGKDKVNLVIFPEGGHGGGDAASTDENMNRIFSFLDRYVR